ncbi:hypothetical protein [Apilactobacillus xinyiensis]|uniref:hypothetical protein n=1 Tax=Apilactobacillus xinyiensis TaxID=2841032 RepID=UPI00200BCDF1|nr:hypothetical protein [Apilactobacillus xinyiensis]MCL0330540.1 hypothetical protein [Apilactobacillus xinyiensis]
MQILNPAVLTQQGMQLMNEAANGLNQISFPKAVTTDDSQYISMNINQLEALSDLDQIKQTIKPDTPLPAYVYADDNGNQQLSDTGTVKSKTATTIPLLFPNKDVTEDYYIQAIGLYAHDVNRDVDILYSVMTAPEPRLQPAYDGTAPTSFKIKSITAVGLTKSLKVELSDFDNVSQEEFQGAIADMAKKSYVDSQLNGKADKSDLDKIDLSSAVNDANKYTDDNAMTFLGYVSNLGYTSYLQVPKDKFGFYENDGKLRDVPIPNAYGKLFVTPTFSSGNLFIYQSISSDGIHRYVNTFSRGQFYGWQEVATDNSLNKLYNQITNDMKSKSNLPRIYNSVDEMNSDSSIQVGDLCFVLGDDI